MPGWIFIRHGETVISAEGKFCSYSDPPLTARGRDSAGQLRAQIDQLSGARLLSSPAVRATETARLAGATPEIVSNLREWNLGELEGVMANEYRQSHPSWSLFKHGPVGSGGETTTQLGHRASLVAERLRDSAPELVVVFSHGQFLRALMVTMLGLPLEAGARFTFGPCRSMFLTDRGDGPVLAGANLPPESLASAIKSDWS